MTQLAGLLLMTCLTNLSREVGVVDWSSRLNVNLGFYWYSCTSTIAAVTDHLASTATGATSYIIV